MAYKTFGDGNRWKRSCTETSHVQTPSVLMGKSIECRGEEGKAYPLMTCHANCLCKGTMDQWKEGGVAETSEIVEG